MARIMSLPQTQCEKDEPVKAQSGYEVEKVWKQISEDLKNEIIRFWEGNNALPIGEDAEERAGQVVFVARNHRREIIALNTAVKIFARRFKNYFYYYRTMTDADFREVGIGIDLLIRTRDFFEGLHREGKSESCIGILANLENEIIAARFRQAVWPRTKFIFMGYNPKGQQVRVYYFEGAVI